MIREALPRVAAICVMADTGAAHHDPKNEREFTVG
jgi:hypothetical protein